MEFFFLGHDSVRDFVTFLEVLLFKVKFIHVNKISGADCAILLCKTTFYETMIKFSFLAFLYTKSALYAHQIILKFSIL